MATQSELNYLRSASAQKKSNQAQGINSINQGGGLLTQSAQAVNDNVQSQEQNGWQRASNFFANTQDAATRGVLNFFDGFWDFGNLVVGGFAKLFGNNQLAEQTQRNSEFNWQDYGVKALNIASMPTQALLNWNQYTDPRFFSDWSQEGLRQQRERTEIVTGNSDLDSKWRGLNEFAGEVAANIFVGQGIGAAVGAIGKGAGMTSKAASALGKGVRVASQAARSAGNAFEQASMEGADFDKAAGYALTKGAIEGATEYAVAPIMNGIASKVGISGRLANVADGWEFAAKAIGEGSAKAIGQAMLEEGSEELVSAILSPLAESIYKGDKALEQYKDGKWWLSEVAGSFAQGAVMGGVMNGVSRYRLRKTFGAQGYSVVEDINESITETNDAAIKFKRGAITSAEYQKVCQDAAEKIKSATEKINSLDDDSKQKLIQYYHDPKQFADEIKGKITSKYTANVMKGGEDGDVIRYETPEGRVFNVVDNGEETVFTPKTEDSARAIDSFLANDIEADSVRLSQSDDGQKFTASKAFIENAMDDGISKEKIAEVFSKFKDGDYTETSADGKQKTVFVETDDGRAYEAKFEDGAKNSTKVLMLEYTDKTEENARKAAQRRLRAKVEKDWMSTAELLRRGAIENTVSNKDIDSFLKTSVDIFTLDNAKPGDASSVVKFTWGEPTSDLAKKLTASVAETKTKEEALALMNQFVDEAIDAGKMQTKAIGGITDSEVIKAKESLKKIAHDMNALALEGAKKSKLSKLQADYQRAVDKLKLAVDELEVKKAYARKFTKAQIKYQEKYGKVGKALPDELPDDEVFAHEAKVLLSPFIGAKWDGKGEVKSQDFKTLLGNAIDAYIPTVQADGSEVKTAYMEDGSRLPFNQILADKMASLYDSLGDDGRLTADQLKQADEIKSIIDGQITEANRKASQSKQDAIAARYTTEMAGKGKGWSESKIGAAIQKGFFTFNATVDDPKVTLVNMTGSDVVKEKVQAVSNGYWLKQAKLTQIRNETATAMCDIMGIEHDGEPSKTQLSKAQHEISKVWKTETDIEAGGRKLTYAEAFWWHAQLSMGEESANAMEAKMGYWVEGKNGKDVRIEYREGIEDELIEAMDKISEGTADRLLDFFKGQYNGALKEDYINWQLKNLNQVDSNALAGDSYFPKTTYNAHRGAGKGVLTDSRSFVNSMSRVARKGSRGIRFADAFGYFNGYCDNLYTESLVRTETDALRRMLDVSLNKDGTETYGTLFTKEQYGLFDQFIKQSLETLEPLRAGVLSKGFVTTTLANPKTFLMQASSYYTSGTDIGIMLKYAPQINAYAIKPSEAVQKGLAEIEKIAPEFALRSKGNEAYRANANTNIGGFTDNVGSFFTAPINMVDRWTVRKIEVAALYEARESIAKARGVSVDSVKFDDKDVIAIASQRARYGYQTQISSAPVYRSPLRYGNIVFGSDKYQAFMKSGLGKMFIGTTRAFGGAIQGVHSYWVRSVGEIVRYRGFDGQKAIEELAQARVDVADNEGKQNELKHTIELMEDKLEGMVEYRNLKPDGEFTDQQYSNLQGDIMALREEIKQTKSKLKATEADGNELKGKVQGMESTLRGYKEFVSSGGAKKRTARLLAGTIMMGAFATGLNELFQRIKGRKRWDEMVDPAEFGKDLALNSTVNLIPIVRTLASMMQGQEVSDPATSGLKYFTSIIEDMRKAIQNGTSANWKKVRWDAIQATGVLFQVPVKNIYDYATGIMQGIDQELALEAKNLFYNVDVGTDEILKADANGDRRTAKALLSRRVSESVGEMSDDVKNELVDLLGQGANAIPSKISTTYEGEDGTLVQISWSKQQEIKRAYAKANAEVRKMLSTAQYKALSAENRAKAIKSLYEAYKGFGYASVLGSSYQGSIPKASRLLALGVGNLSPIMAVASALKAIEPTDKKSKRELAVEYVKKCGLMGADKIIALYLAGFSVDKDSLKSALSQKGVSKKDAEKFVGGEKNR